MKTIFEIRLALARRNPLRKIGFKHMGRKSVIFKPLLLNGKKYMKFGDGVTFMPGARIECIRNYAGGGV